MRTAAAWRCTHDQFVQTPKNSEREICSAQPISRFVFLGNVLRIAAISVSATLVKARAVKEPGQQVTD
jgi:hypothetical protein